MRLRLSELSKVYNEQGNTVCVFDRIDFGIEHGQFIGIVGPSGCGKTTLLRIIAGLEPASCGKLFLDEKEIIGRDKRIGLVFQEYALFPWRTALKNIEIGLEIIGIPREKRRLAAMEYIRAFDLSGFEHTYPKDLSGGMKQRVAIARTLITNPEIVLMDEPFASLDSQTRNDLQKFLLDIWNKRRETILFVTHNIDEAVYLCDRIIVLSKRPARVVNMFDVCLKRPRDRTSLESNLIRREILNMIETPSNSPP